MFIKHNTTDFQNNYLIGRQIGSGSFGTVYICTHIKTGSQRAVKVLPKSRVPEENAKIKQELEILRELDHPNIVKLYEYFEDGKRFYIVTE